MIKQFWVVGGEFSCLEFRELSQAAPPIGPFTTYDEAEGAWRAKAEQTRSEARKRFTIVTTAQNPRRMQPAA